MTRPSVVVITDRKLYASEELAGCVAAILAGVPRGSVAIQLREKDLDGGPLLLLARELAPVCAKAGAQLWINDRVDIALACGAYGVHLPEAGLAVADARLAIAGGTLALAASRHDEAGVLAAARDGAELVQLGPIFDSRGKPGVGPALLGVRARPATTQLVAVGGIDSPTRVREAIAAGADAVAVIRAVWTADDPAAMVRMLVQACLDSVHMTR